MADGPAAPYVASQGHPLNSNSDFFVFLENECILRTKQMTDALLLTFMLFYVFWLDYPKQVCCTLKYIQNIIFERNSPEDGSMPSKLIRFINKFHS